MSESISRQAKHDFLRALIVDDSDDDAELVLRSLRGVFKEVHSSRVETADAMSSALARGDWHVILCDWSMPRFGALEALRMRSHLAVDVPFIIVSGTVGEDQAVKAMQAGANDYVLKGNLARLGPAVSKEVMAAASRAELRSRRNIAERFFNLTLDLFCVVGWDGTIKRSNPAWLQVLGWSSMELLSRPWQSFVHPDDLIAAQAISRQVVAHPSSPLVFEARFRAKGGSYRYLLWRAEPFPAERLIYAAAHDITDRKRAEDELRFSEEQYRMVFEGSPSPKWLFDLDAQKVVAVNEAAQHQYGYDREAFLGLGPSDFEASGQNDVSWAAREPATLGTVPLGVSAHKTKSGAIVEMDIVAHTFDLRGRLSRLVVATNVTERSSLQAQLIQAQKMEAVGRLAGGIAHDFNNLIGIIMAFAELSIEDLGEQHPVTAQIREISSASQRAAILVRQLMAFGRKQSRQPRILSLNEVVANTEALLRRTIAEDVVFSSKLADDLWPVNADPVHIEQVLLNLVVNARDAMKAGGKVIIRTHNATLGEREAAHVSVAPGDYAVISVTDTGCGMDAETLLHIFEPFFTTKEVGKGTGLGLSTVFGIVKQGHGGIAVKSEVGVGSTFEVYLARSVLVPDAESPQARERRQTGVETVLVVEDEAQLLTGVSAILRKAGYSVVEANSPELAIRIFQFRGDDIQLVLTDVVMPGLTGMAMIEELGLPTPSVKVIYMSGHGVDEPLQGQPRTPGTHYVAKPFSSAELLLAVRGALDDRADREVTNA
jgi:two-component system cell cycle sensor histidine kinase/response regulator CckA